MENSIVLWRGNPDFHLKKYVSELEPAVYQRFFLPREILISRYGIVAMIVVDNKPERRSVSYMDGDWTGVPCGGRSEFEGDPVLHAHFSETEKGCSIIRVFILPEAVSRVFESDDFLGDPMIAKCACNETFETSFDELPASPGFSPVQEVLPFIEKAALAAWQDAHMGEKGKTQVRAWLSFHAWFAFAPAVEEAQVSLEKALQNFDRFLQRFAEQLPHYKRLPDH